MLLFTNGNSNDVENLLNDIQRCQTLNVQFGAEISLVKLINESKILCVTAIKDTVPSISSFGCCSDEQNRITQYCNKTNFINSVGIERSVFCENFMKNIRKITAISG